MPGFATPPIAPVQLTLSSDTGRVTPAGPVLTRRMSDLEGLFADRLAWRDSADGDDPVVYTVSSSPVPETDRELPQSITSIMPGECGGELYMTKGHQHPDPQGEIYLGLAGVGGILLFDGAEHRWIEMAPGVLGYIPPGWAHRSINTGSETYRFLAVYPGCAGHDYGWVLQHGMGARARRTSAGFELVAFGPPGA